jgi:hypothetical protein
MFFTSSWFPSRIPVSLVLLPIFWLVLAISPNLNQWRALWVLVVVHGFLYASVNGFNSYFQQRKKINSLVKERKASRVVLSISVVLSALAIVFSFLEVSPLFATFVTIYSVVAISFNHPLIYWRKFPMLSWGLTGMIQGIFTFVMLYIGINRFSIENIGQAKILLPATLVSLILWAVYPILFKDAFTSSASNKFHVIFALKSNRLFFVVLLLLTLVIVFAAFYLKDYISWIYFPPLLLFYVAGIILLYLNFLNSNKGYAKFLSWSVILGLNAFSFYIFTDYTNIFQLI